MFFSDYLSAFLRQKRIDNLSKKSISNYAYFIERFLRFVGADTLPVDLTMEQVQEYILSLHVRHLSAATMATYIRNMKIFLRYVECKEPLSFSLAEIRLPRVPKKVVQWPPCNFSKGGRFRFRRGVMLHGGCMLFASILHALKCPAVIP